MRLEIDLTGSDRQQDELDYLADAQRAVIALLDPSADLDRAGRDRLAILLSILDTLRTAICRASSK